MRYITIFMFLYIITIGQIRFEKIFEIENINLPEKVRIENCGIFAISDFCVDYNNNVFLKTHDSKIVYKFNKDTKEKLSKIDGTIYIDKLQKLESTGDAEKSIVSVNNKKYFGKDGYYKSVNGDYINLVVDESGNFTLEDSEAKKSFEINNQNIFYADLIGKDLENNYYLIIEKILNHIPLKVERSIVVINSFGTVINRLQIPTIKYLTINNEFYFDDKGALFHFLSDDEKTFIIKITGLNSKTNEVIKYPEELQKFVHYDHFTKNDEQITNLGYVSNPELAVSRNNALKIADSYVNYKYICKSQNLAPNGITGPDGDIVKTPPYLKVGWNAKIPYMWGGFSTLADFYSGITYLNYYAGDIHTTGVSNYAVGVDCSGFVSRCWQLSYHASTAYMPNITTQLSDWTKIKPGDAILKPGHVRLFVNRAQNGALRIAEASSRDWAVSYWSYAISDLGSYTPNKYNQIETDFNETLITLYSSVKQDNKVKLVWKSDTTNLKGYRLYRSTNGKNWYILLDENNLTSSQVLLDMPQETNFYRITIVKNSTAGLLESNYSNIVGVSPLKDNNKNYLIVDGFNRNIGTASFQGIFNPFSVSYGMGLRSAGASFDIIKNSALKLDTIDINNYSGIFWYVGDESTGDETLDDFEQTKLKEYLDNGGNLFVCGSEIGYDLYEKGSESDKFFFENYLKAKYISDNAVANAVKTTVYSIFDSLQFYIGQTYSEDYPDVIDPINGSINCFSYTNNKGAGIIYEGFFGNTTKKGKIVYLGFPLESTADDSSFNKVIRNVKTFFENSISKIDNEVSNNLEFIIENAYPNPFNGITNLSFSLNKKADVIIKIYNIIGEEIEILQNGELEAGKYQIKFENNRISTGIYIANFKINNKIYSLKLSLIK